MSQIPIPSTPTNRDRVFSDVCNHSTRTANTRDTKGTKGTKDTKQNRFGTFGFLVSFVSFVFLCVANEHAQMLEGLKHLRYTADMNESPRRLVTRACEVCDWTGTVVESEGTTFSGDCPQCHAPTRTVRQEVVFDVEERRAQAAALGRVGGLKGGRIRAQRLSAKRRTEIARKAAAARWKRR